MRLVGASSCPAMPSYCWKDTQKCRQRSKLWFSLNISGLEDWNQGIRSSVLTLQPGGKSCKINDNISEKEKAAML